MHLPVEVPNQVASQQGFQHRLTELWSLFLKDDSWINEVLEYKSEPYSPRLNVMGRDLPRILAGRTEHSYLVLIMHDHTGDVQYLREKFFKSLQPHTYDQEKGEVYFLGSGITLNVSDAVSPVELIPIYSPTRLFYSSWNELNTFVTRYGDDKLYLCPDSSIGGLIEIGNRRKAIEDICYVRIPYAPNFDFTALFIKPSADYSGFYPMKDPKVSGTIKITGWIRSRGPPPQVAPQSAEGTS